MALDRGLPTGRTVGDIYAWGAAGSIVGTFLAGFYLIATMGTIAIIWAVGAALLLMGILYVLLVEKLTADPIWRSFLMVGLLGAFTTFSTFSLETLQLLEAGALLRAGLNVLVSVVSCVLAVWAGTFVGRHLI